MPYFKRVFQFDERDEQGVVAYERTRAAFERMASITSVGENGEAEHCVLTLPDGTRLDAGIFVEKSVADLRNDLRLAVTEDAEAKRSLQEYFESSHSAGRPVISFDHIVGESKSMHSMPQYEGAVFQAASQFNYLEMPNPDTVPEHGISEYDSDHTQGPSCACACAAGTAYRNYLIRVDQADPSGRGQRHNRQLNGLRDVEAAVAEMAPEALKHANFTSMLKKQLTKFWTIRNGYSDAKNDELDAFNTFLFPHCQDLCRHLRIGIQADTQVCNPDVINKDVHVTQTYNSAISVNYSCAAPEKWQPMAQEILRGTYEATLLVGALKGLAAIKRGRRTPLPVLLTKVGGGVFGNPSNWIVGAVRHALNAVEAYRVPLDVRLVHYRRIDDAYLQQYTQV